MNDNQQGFIFGKVGEKYITKNENEDGHILVIGGVGSGKSSRIAIPSLLSWNESIFCIDIKGELHEVIKQSKPNMKVFDPLNIKDTVGYNPFYILNELKEKAREESEEYGLEVEVNYAQEAEAISMALIPLPPNTPDPFWIESARCMLTGMLLHFYISGYTFIETMEMIQSTPIKKLIDEIYNKSESKEAKFYIISFVGMALQTLSGVYAEMSRHIKIFVTDKNVRACLSKSDNIEPMDLEYGSDIYIYVHEHLLRQWKSLITLMINQFLRHFEKRPDKKADPILFLLDEFPRLGKMDGITDALATLRSKKITICIMIQSLAQLDLIYGKETRQVIADTCQYKAIMNVSEVESQEYFSRLVGTHDVEKESETVGSGMFKPIKTNYGTQTTMEEKRIIKPENFATLKDIVFLSPDGYSRIDKVDPYYEKENPTEVFSRPIPVSSIPKKKSRIDNLSGK